jgi:hypothetical protein
MMHKIAFPLVILNACIFSGDSTDYTYEIIASASARNSVNAEHYFIVKITIPSDKEFAVLSPVPTTLVTMGSGTLGRKTRDYEELHALAKGENLISCNCSWLSQMTLDDGTIELILPLIRKAEILVLELSGDEEKRNGLTLIMNAVRHTISLSGSDFSR